VKEEGKQLIKREVENFLEGRKAKAKYLKLIKFLKLGYNSWSSLKKAFNKDGLRISDSQLNMYIKELIDFGFVEKVDGKYFLTDPLLLV
jgi:predicted transcriptional regulator